MKETATGAEPGCCAGPRGIGGAQDPQGSEAKGSQKAVTGPSPDAARVLGASEERRTRRGPSTGRAPRYKWRAGRAAEGT